MTKPPTLQDVAGAAGMHKSTVSLALSGKGNLSAATRARVLSVAREMGYEPNLLAQRLAQGLNNTLICIVSGVLDVGLATEKILLIQRGLTARSLEVPIYTCSEPVGGTGESQAAQIKQLCRQRPRAILCASQRMMPAVFRELESYRKQGGAVVSYDTPVPLDCDQVIFDRHHNAYQAARYLLERGHRRIGFAMSDVNGWFAGAENVPQTHRERGFRRAMEEFGQPVREDWLFRNPLYEKGGAEMARRFLALKDRPTGLCIVNDYVALAFMVEITRAGLRVPEDVSIVGHDDQPIAAYCPTPLTSAIQPVDAIARSVVSLLAQRLEGAGSADPERVVITGEMVERESVASLSRP